MAAPRSPLTAVHPRRPVSNPDFDLPTLASCNFTALRMASRRISQAYDVALAPAGIKTTQLSILAALERLHATPPTINELAARLVLDRSTLGQNLRPLERDGLLQIRADAADARMRRLVLSQAGRAKLRQGVACWQTAQRQFEARVGAADAAALRRMLFSIALDAPAAGPWK